MPVIKSTKSKSGFLPKPSSTFSALTAKDAHYTASKVNAPPKEAILDHTGDDGVARRPPRSNGSGLRRDLPKAIQLPYAKAGLRSHGFGRIIETDSKDGKPTKTMGKLRTRKENPKIPAWLIELNESQLDSIMSIKKLLESEIDDKKILDQLANIINSDLGIEIGIRELCGILKETPKNETDHFSFSHFMFFTGNPGYAKQKIEYAPNRRSRLNCISMPPDNCSDGNQAMDAGGDQSVNEKDDSDEMKKKTTLSKSSENATTHQKGRRPYSTATTNYNQMLREKVFYTGLLIFEMYDTLRGVERLYFDDFIPPHKEGRGLGSNDIGFKKMGFAEWDKPLPSLPTISPYLTPVPFVTTRWAVSKPNEDEKGRRRTLTTLQPMHLVIEPPKDTHNRDPIRITENRMRIREALMYLAAKGDCVALLPDVYYVIHLSDTFVDKLEEVSTKATATPPKKEVRHNDDIAWIAREIKALYTPHGLPEHINRIPHLIKFSDGIKLRQICDSIRANQWAYVCNKKLEFREKAWQVMRIDHLPEGSLKTSFINSFVTYLPYISHLPITHQRSHPNPL